MSHVITLVYIKFTRDTWFNKNHVKLMSITNGGFAMISVYECENCRYCLRGKKNRKSK